MTTIREGLRKLTTINTKTSLSVDIHLSGDPLMSFRHTTEDEVRAILGKAPNKACALDPIPTSNLKKTLSAVVPFITNIINVSFNQSEVPYVFKEALVRLLLKKSGLDKEVYKIIVLYLISPLSRKSWKKLLQTASTNIWTKIC